MMYLSYHEIINLMNREREKHREILKDSSPQANKEYSRNALFVIRDLEKEIRKHLAKKYK